MCNTNTEEIQPICETYTGKIRPMCNTNTGECAILIQGKYRLTADKTKLMNVNPETDPEPRQSGSAS